MLQRAFERLTDDKLAPEFKKLEPDNGWGTVDGAAEVAMTLRELAEEYPDNVWEVY